MKAILISGILIMISALLSFGQSYCPKNLIFGTWKSVGSRPGYESVVANVDSLRKIIRIDTIPFIYDFQLKGTYTYTNPKINPKNPYIKKDVFTIDEKTCEIILGTKKKAYKKSNLVILYVDENSLILTENNNPHGDYTTLYSK